MVVGSAKSQELLELTNTQLMIWRGEQITPDRPLYNVPYSFEFEGGIDPERFRRAFQNLAEEADSLRSVFVETAEGPRRRILSEVIREIEFEDLSDKEDPDAYYQAWLDSRIVRNLDVSSCCYDTVLIKIDSDRYCWFINQHHLITDANGVAALYRRMSELYKNGAKTGLSLPRSAEVIAGSYPAEAPPAGEKTSNPTRLYGETSAANETLAKRTEFQIEGELLKKLETLSERPGFRGLTADLSVFQLFATVVFAYIARVSGFGSATIASPLANRGSDMLDRSAELLIDFSPLACVVRKSDTFEGLYNRVRMSVSEFLKSNLQGGPRPNSTRDLNVVFNFLNPSFGKFADITCHARWLHAGHIDTNHDLRIHCYRQSGGITLYFDTKTATFGADRGGEFLDHFLTLLRSFVDDPSQKILSRPLAGYEAAKLSGPRQNFDDVIQGFEKTAKENPDAVAAVDGDRRFTYRELDSHANRYSALLDEGEYPEGSRVGILLQRSPELIAAILGVLRTGRSFVPFDVKSPAKRIEDLLKRSESVVLVTDRNLETESGISQKVPRVFVQEARRADRAAVAIRGSKDSEAYVLFTSGSTGTPKGVSVSRNALSNYLGWAAKTYGKVDMPFFTSIGFDLTLTSVFVPLLTGGSVSCFESNATSTDDSIIRVIGDTGSNAIKLTPSQLLLLLDSNSRALNFSTFIVGGEEFSPSLAGRLISAFPNARVYNEYGPTESTVGCIAHRLSPDEEFVSYVPVGTPTSNNESLILDQSDNPVPQGVIGDLWVLGESLADGYIDSTESDKSPFASNPFRSGEKIYRTGDLARVNRNGDIECLGRADRQLKISGHRVEPAEIENSINHIDGVRNCAVLLTGSGVQNNTSTPEYCLKCGLPSNYPGAQFDAETVCSFCRSFGTYEQNAKAYFQTTEDLVDLVKSKTKGRDLKYDCLVLLSGGKDSTYVLAQIVELGFRPLAFTLDNGFISPQAKENISRVVKDLDVDHVFGSTPAMDKIFVDSINRFSNVCNGCFKTIYTLAANLALKERIPFVITGLSRGQFFETRLTEELFRDMPKPGQIEKTISEARQAYHRADDAVKRFLDTRAFESGEVFRNVEFVDFYRYHDVSLSEILDYLNSRLPWIRPDDTGRSTNCLINKVGISIHRERHGYSNYAFPYSWDVRIGHKTRKEALAEVNEVIDEGEVREILKEIGYTDDHDQDGLTAFIETERAVSDEEIRLELESRLPRYMIPARFVRVESLPLTESKKVNYSLLAKERRNGELETEFEPAGTDLEELVLSIWNKVLNRKSQSIVEDFLRLGGQSLQAIRITARLVEELGLELPVDLVFSEPTVKSYSGAVEKILITEMESERSV